MTKSNLDGSRMRYWVIYDKVWQGETKRGHLDDKGLLRIRECDFSPHVGDLILVIIKVAHSLKYSIHPDAIKLYRDLRQHY